MTISFTEQDLLLFSQASGDRNPLHLNETYARRTPYGQQVVFGCLGAIACLQHLPRPAGSQVRSLEAKFLRPMFLRVQYRIEANRKDDAWEAKLFDGRTLVVSIKLTADPDLGDPLPTEEQSAAEPMRLTPATRSSESLVEGLTVSGAWACDTEALEKLTARWGGVDPLLATVLCQGSYLVGMELPGESALFSEIALQFARGLACPAAMTYQATVVSVDPRFGSIEMDVSLRAGTSLLVSGQISSYVRPELAESEDGFPAVTTDSMAGKVALVLGSSRGLGSATRRALTLRGATVYGLSRSESPAEPTLTETGDAADPEALRRLRERISARHGRLDFLICNACPPILPLRVEPNSAGRIADYINRAVALTLQPLSEFLDLLNRSNGCAVIVSSSAVDDPLKEWPHYIAAKQAVEALATVAAMQYLHVSSLIVRPPKLLTGMTNTPMGRMGATSPARIANSIADRLEDPIDPRKTEILTFPAE